MLPAGKLREVVVVEKATDAGNAVGEIASTWATFATIRAAVVPISGRESFVGGRLVAEADITFRIRHRTDLVSETMRFNWRSRYFDLVSILDPDGRRMELTVLGKERKD